MESYLEQFSASGKFRSANESNLSGIEWMAGGRDQGYWWKAKEKYDDYLLYLDWENLAKMESRERDSYLSSRAKVPFSYI